MEITKIVTTGHVDNTGTFRELMDTDPSMIKWDFKDQRLMFIRYNRALLFNFVERFKQKEGMVVLREIFDDKTTKPFHIDQYILEHADTLQKISDAVTLSQPSSLIIHPFNIQTISEQSWDHYLDYILELFDYTQIESVSFGKILDLIELILQDENIQKGIKEYLTSKDIQYTEDNYYILHMTSLIEQYWKKIGFSITFQDTDFYNVERKMMIDKVLECFFGYTNEILIIVTRFDWDDNFELLKTYLGDNAKFQDALISFRIDTITPPPIFYISTLDELHDILSNIDFDNAADYLKKYIIGLDESVVKHQYSLLYPDLDIPEFNINLDTSIVWQKYYDVLFPGYNAFFELVMSNSQVWAFEFTMGYIGNEGEPYNYNDLLYEQEMSELQITPYENIGDAWIRNNVLENGYKQIFAALKTKILDLNEN